jgi:hypothetical protein
MIVFIFLKKIEFNFTHKTKLSELSELSELIYKIMIIINI